MVEEPHTKNVMGSEHSRAICDMVVGYMGASGAGSVIIMATRQEGETDSAMAEIVALDGSLTPALEERGWSGREYLSRALELLYGRALEPTVRH